jgi:hydroxyacylglutathione hydrolase
MTGDSLYPGRLGVQLAQVPTFAASAQLFAAFVTVHDVAHVLVTHIEQTKTAFLVYPRDTNYQPEEHSIDLTRAHVIELNAFIKMGNSPATIALPEFTISVRIPAPASAPQSN